MSDHDDDKLRETDARMTATIAMSQTSARLSNASFLAGCPEPPKRGTPEHQAMLNGKDATIAMAVAALRVEQQHGGLAHLTPDDMLAVGAILIGVDIALSRRLGVDVRGNPLQ